MHKLKKLSENRINKTMHINLMIIITIIMIIVNRIKERNQKERDNINYLHFLSNLIINSDLYIYNIHYI